MAGNGCRCFRLIFLSCSLVGILAVGSVRTGLPTLAQSRFAFGYHGNKIPTFFGYVANMGWKVTMLSMASTTLADLLSNFNADFLSRSRDTLRLSVC